MAPRLGSAAVAVGNWPAMTMLRISSGTRSPGLQLQHSDKLRQRPHQANRKPSCNVF